MKKEQNWGLTDSADTFLCICVEQKLNVLSSSCGVSFYLIKQLAHLLVGQKVLFFFFTLSSGSFAVLVVQQISVYF